MKTCNQTAMVGTIMVKVIYNAALIIWIKISSTSYLGYETYSENSTENLINY